MSTLLAWVSILLILYLFSLKLIKSYTKMKGRNVTTSFKLGIIKLRKYHKPAGMVLLLFGLGHGYLALGNRFSINHSGFMVWLFVLVVAVLGMIRENSDNEKVENAHIQYAILIIVALVYHFILPGPLFK